MLEKIIGMGLVICGILILFGVIVSGMGTWVSSSDNEERSIQVSGIEAIDVDVSAANVHVIPDPGNELIAVLADGNKSSKVMVNREGKTMKIAVDRSWLSWWPFGNSLTLNIYVPNGYNESMAFSVGSGNVKFNGDSKQDLIILDGLNLDIKSGNVDMTNVQVNHLDNETLSGRIAADYMSAKTAKFDVKSGRVSLDHYKGGLNVEILSGRFSAQIDELTDDVNMDVKSGRASLDLPKSADFNLDAHAMSGKVSCNFPLQNAKIDDDNTIKGSHETGKYLVKLRVLSGRLDIN